MILYPTHLYCTHLFESSGHSATHATVLRIQSTFPEYISGPIGMSWVKHGRGSASPCVHGTAPSRTAAVQAAKRSINAAVAADVPLQQDMMAMHRVPTRRSPDPAKLDRLRSRDSIATPGMEEVFELRLHHSSDSARSALESGWEAAPSKVVYSAKKRTRRVRRSSCPARTSASKPKRAAGFVAADTFLSALESEVSTIGVDHGGLSSRTLRLLSREEERKLFVLVGRCTAHSVRYRGDITPEDVAILSKAMSVSAASAESIIEQAHRAHDVLFQFNLRLVAALARKYTRSGFSVPFLMAEATHGLSDAIDRFDLSRDCKFSSFAFHYVLRDIRKCIVAESRLILMPAGAHYTLAKLMKAKERMLARLPPGEREAVQDHFNVNPEAMHKALAADVGVSEAVVARVMKAGLPSFDLDAPVFDSNDDTWLEYCVGVAMGGDENHSAGAEGEYEAEVKEQVALRSLESLLATLDARESNILRLRYGLNAEGRTITYAEIAAAYNLSTERVRQICDGALRKLAKPWRQEFLQEQSQDLI